MPILAIIALVLLPVIMGPVGARRALANAFAGSVTARKNLTLDSVSGISATETDTAVYDTRGWKNIIFTYNVSAQTGGTADTNYFILKIQGSNSATGTFTDLADLATGQLLAVGSGQLPADQDKEIVLPRFIRVRWEETGTMTGFSAEVFAHFDRDAPGKEYQPAYRGG